MCFWDNKELEWMHQVIGLGLVSQPQAPWVKVICYGVPSAILHFQLVSLSHQKQKVTAEVRPSSARKKEILSHRIQRALHMYLETCINFCIQLWTIIIILNSVWLNKYSLSTLSVNFWEPPDYTFEKGCLGMFTFNWSDQLISCVLSLSRQFLHKLKTIIE